VGPFISSDDAREHELDMSLLERLFERPVYADHPMARSKLRNRNWSTSQRQGSSPTAPPGLPPPPPKPITTGYAPFVNLVKVRRHIFPKKKSRASVADKRDRITAVILHCSCHPLRYSTMIRWSLVRLMARFCGRVYLTLACHCCLWETTVKSSVSTRYDWHLCLVHSGH
jgi:hypothetical protein